MFYRLHSDGVAQPVDLRGVFGGTTRTGCWLIGGGPSLGDLPVEAIAASPLPRFAVNLAGHRLLRPTFWTSYDPTARFQRSIYLDPGILKFVHRCRAMDLVPGTTFKVCDSPATLCFDRDPHRGYHDFLSAAPAAPRTGDPAASCDRAAANPAGGVTDWQDSLVQAIDIAWRLGFRTLYLAGCDMFISPAPEQLALAQSVGVDYRPRELLRDFFDRCRQSGLALCDFESLPQPRQYHFDERKSLAAALQTDLHYFRVAQYLRLARRAMSLAGLELVSVTPQSRLNDCFPYRAVAEVVEEILATIGDPRSETAAGRYTDPPAASPAGLAPMRDFPPHNWARSAKAPAVRPAPAAPPEPDRTRLRDVVAALPEIPVDLNEQG